MKNRFRRSTLLLALVAGGLLSTGTLGQAQVLNSSWIDTNRVMVIYNTVKMDSVDPAEPATFSHDMGEWYMQRYGMPTNHLFGYNMGKRVRWSYLNVYAFLQAVADYIATNDIQIVLMAPGIPLITRDSSNSVDLTLSSLAGHALWFAHVKQEGPTSTSSTSLTPTTSNLYFPYVDMGDGASPYIMLTSDASRWIPGGGSLASGSWYDTRMMDLRNHPSVRPFGRIGLPYYSES